MTLFHIVAGDPWPESLPSFKEDGCILARWGGGGDKGRKYQGETEKDTKGGRNILCTLARPAETYSRVGRDLLQSRVVHCATRPAECPTYSRVAAGPPQDHRTPESLG